MKQLLTLALLLCALATLTEASCFVRDAKSNGTHCFDVIDNTWYENEATWRNSECYDCSCRGCCSAYSTPRAFPEDCVSVFNQALCEYIVHKKGDPSTLCPIWASVGK
ncbi:beta-microseminoprotein-like [Synchiropus splendidus]|uniref:beta-microseminoprotein-like n=1 Tax=Synchiropus splendidus TaxID=270530 RepID=UPI00237D35AC|nr:beta-microseminoprotein-like [Synchiropus splendidus]